MRFEQLQALMEVAKAGSIRGAADNMFITPQAISLSIKQLEEELGKELLMRKNNGVELTKAGKETLAFAEETLSLKNRFLVDFCANEEETTFSYRLKIISASSTINYVLPDILRQINRKRNQITIRLDHVDRLEDLLEQIAMGNGNLGLISINEDELMTQFAAYSKQLCMAILVRDEMVIVTDRKNVREGQFSITAEEMATHPCTACNIVIRNEYREGSMETNMAVSNDMDFHRRMIDKMGACVQMPGLAHQVFFNSKKYVALECDGFKNTIIHCAVYRRSEQNNMKEFVEMIQKELYTK